ncbi:protein N-acetylglucosaminyltransferase [Aureococcus anophagefferens]|nr:protein N-acetylglucosaminyltransferase [Aureococcus anophagefferens]
MATFARASSPTPGGALLKRAPYLETEEQAAQQPHRTYYYRQNHGEAGCEASIARCTAELASASGEVARALRRERAGYHARGLSPKHFRARFDRAFALDALGDLPRAVLDYTAAIAIDASHALAPSSTRSPARPARRSGAAAKDRFPVADFYHNRAFCKRKLADFSGAVDDYAAALAKDPKHFKALYNRAFCLDALGRRAEALKDYEAALALRPAHASAHHNRGVVLEKLGELEAALRAFDTAIQLVGDGADKAPPPPGRRPRADSPTADDSQCFSDALALDPAHRAARANRAYARRKLGHYGDAAADYALALKAALADGPERAPAADDADADDAGGDRRTRRGDVAVAKLYNARAYCLAKMDDFHGAVDDYSAALEHDADNTHALHNRGISRDRLGLDALAMADFNRVLDIEQKQAAAKRAAKEKRSSSRRSHSPP